MPGVRLEAEHDWEGAGVAYEPGQCENRNGNTPSENGVELEPDVGFTDTLFSSTGIAANTKNEKYILERDIIVNGRILTKWEDSARHSQKI